MARNNDRICDGCGRPTNRVVCLDCTATTRRNLATIHDTIIPGPTQTYHLPDGTEATKQTGPDRLIPGLATDLDTAITKQTRFNTPNGGRRTGHAAPLPLNLAASDARQHLTTTLATWAGHAAHARGDVPPARTLYGLAEYLDTVLDWISHQDAGRHAVDDINAAIAKAKRVTDRPADRAYAGPCHIDDCDGELYAWDDAAMARCTTCRTETPLVERRDDLLDQAHDLLLPAADIERLLRALGAPVDAKTVRKWAERGRLTNRGGIDAPRYRVGDVLILTAQNPHRKAAA